MSDILSQIIEKRKNDIATCGIDFGIKIPKERQRKIHPFLKDKGLILEVKRASPSKGDIAVNLDSKKTALDYAKNGAMAISCLTEQNYFKGSLNDLMNVCQAVDEFEAETKKTPPAVLRKDFLLSVDEVDLSYRAGADAVLLITRILSEALFLSMARKIVQLGISALVEVRSEEDVQKIASIFSDTDLKKCTGESGNFVFGVNSRDLATFEIDLLQPFAIMQKIRTATTPDARVIFESGVTTPECASVIGSAGFYGILLGEAAAKDSESAGKFVRAFASAEKNENSEFWLEYAQNLPPENQKSPKVKICGLTRIEDAILAEKCGAAFLGFIFADKFQRSLTHGERLEKILPELKNLSAKKVAVIVDLDSSEAKKAIELVKNGILDLLQFHKIPYCDVNPEFLKIPHYFATDNKADFETFTKKGELRVLLDLHGKNSDLNFSEAKWLAGGITPEKLPEIIQNFSPELIDVSGGIEDEREIGIKNEKKMRQLFKNIKI